MSHTPGPWVYDSDGDWSLVSAGPETIAEVTSLMKDSDGRLIAAAPDLLEVLQRLLAAYDDTNGIPTSLLGIARVILSEAE